MNEKKQPIKELTISEFLDYKLKSITKPYFLSQDNHDSIELFEYFITQFCSEWLVPVQILKEDYQKRKNRCGTPHELSKDEVFNLDV